MAQVSIPLWALVHLPVVVTITTAVFTPTVSVLKEPPNNKRCMWRCSSNYRIHRWPITDIGATKHPDAVQKCIYRANDGCFALTLLVPAQGWLHCILYVLFENAMGIVKLWAVIAGAWHCLHPPSCIAQVHCLPQSVSLQLCCAKVYSFSKCMLRAHVLWLPHGILLGRQAQYPFA